MSFEGWKGPEERRKCKSITYALINLWKVGAKQALHGVCCDRGSGRKSLPSLLQVKWITLNRTRSERLLCTWPGLNWLNWLNWPEWQLFTGAFTYHPGVNSWSLSRRRQTSAGSNAFPRPRWRSPPPWCHSRENRGDTCRWNVHKLSTQQEE